MGRKQREKTEITDKLSQRISDLIIDAEITKKSFADEIGYPKSAASQWANGKQRPEYEALVSIADYFNVSTDYLLGRTNTKTADMDTRVICEHYNLSETTLSKLLEWKVRFPELIEILNRIIGTMSFEDMLDAIRLYLLFGNSDDKLIYQIRHEDQLRAMTYIENAELTDDALRYVALKSNLDVNDIKELYLQKAQKDIWEIVRELAHD